MEMTLKRKRKLLARLKTAGRHYAATAEADMERHDVYRALWHESADIERTVIIKTLSARRKRGT